MNDVATTAGKLSPSMRRSLVNLAACGGRIGYALKPLREAGVNARSIDSLVNRGLAGRAAPLDGARRPNDYIITELGRDVAEYLAAPAEQAEPTAEPIAERPTVRVFAGELRPGSRVADDSARGDGTVFRTETMDAYPINKVLVWFYGNSYAASYWADDSVEVFADVVWCDQCAGTGTVHDPKDCPTCYGQGWWNGE